MTNRRPPQLALLVLVPLLFAARIVGGQESSTPFEGAPPEPATEAVTETQPAAPDTQGVYEGAPPEPADESKASADIIPDFPAPAQTPEQPAPESPETVADQLLPPGTLVPTSPRELLALYGIDESNFLVMIDGESISDAEREVFLRVLYRVRKFSRVDVADWLVREPDFSYENLYERPDDYRGELIPVLGRMKEVVLARPPREVKNRYEMEEFYFCKLQLEGSERMCWVVTTVLPEHLQTEGAADERVSAAGMFMKISASPDGSQPLVFIASRLAWHPDRVETDEGVSLGMTILGDLAVDVGLLDVVQDRRRIVGREREIFYQMLWGVGGAGTQQLERQALMNLNLLKKGWRAEVEAFNQQTAEMRQQMEEEGLSILQRQARLKDVPGHRRMLIAKRCLQKAEENQFSVFPLFNQPDEYRGELVVLEGTARRALPIQLGKGLERGQANHDVVSRFGIEKYYEIEIFTEDSQNNPLVFCVRQLPEGFPEGEAINEHVRIAGFFLKSWAYFTQQPADVRPDGSIEKRQQLAPLLIGREPSWLIPEPPPRNPYIGLMAGGLFVLAVVGAWVAVWRFNRRDAEFHKRFVGPRYAESEGASLNDIGLEAEEAPNFRHLEER